MSAYQTTMLNFVVSRSATSAPITVILVSFESPFCAMHFPTTRTEQNYPLMDTIVGFPKFKKRSLIGKTKLWFCAALCSCTLIFLAIFIIDTICFSLHSE